MTDSATTKKSAPKRSRASVELLKNRVISRSARDNYRGVNPKNILWNTLAYDKDKKRQVIDIKTVDADNQLDGNTRTVATSDLHLVKHTKDVSKLLQKKRANVRRRKGK